MRILQKFEKRRTTRKRSRRTGEKVAKIQGNELPLQFLPGGWGGEESQASP